MVRTYWFLPIFYEAIDILDLQPPARTDRVEACRPLGWCAPILRDRIRQPETRVGGNTTTPAVDRVGSDEDPRLQ